MKELSTYFFICLLQVGHVCWISSHLTRQRAWKTWPQDTWRGCGRLRLVLQITQSSSSFGSSAHGVFMRSTLRFIYCFLRSAALLCMYGSYTLIEKIPSALMIANHIQSVDSNRMTEQTIVTPVTNHSKYVAYFYTQIESISPSLRCSNTVKGLQEENSYKIIVR